MKGRAAALAAATSFAAVAAVAVAGCTESGSPGPEDLELDLVVGAEVRIVDFGFEPGEVTVAVGELVEFTNGGDDDHTVTADGDRFDSGELRPGETFSYDTNRDDPGTIEYHCEIHERMRARITIEAGQE